MAIRSRESIASAASLICGLEPISDLDTDSREAQVLDGLFDFTFDSLIGKTSWNFNIEDVVLSKDSVTLTDNQWDFQYQLPLDFMESISLYDEGGTHGYDYHIQKDKLFTRLDAARLKYKKETTIVDVPAYFIEPFTFQLASNAAEALTGITGLSNKLATEAAQKLNVAITTDGRSMAAPTYWVKSRVTRGRR